MRKRNQTFKIPAILFAAGFFLGLFIKLLPFFIILMLLFLSAYGIFCCLFH